MLRSGWWSDYGVQHVARQHNQQAAERCQCATLGRLCCGPGALARNLDSKSREVSQWQACLVSKHVLM